MIGAHFCQPRASCALRLCKLQPEPNAVPLRLRFAILSIEDTITIGRRVSSVTLPSEALRLRAQVRAFPDPVREYLVHHESGAVGVAS